MKSTLSSKNGTLVQKIINEKDDTRDMYGNRYLEIDSPDVPIVGKKYFVWVSHYVGPNSNYDSSEKLRWSDDDERNAALTENGMGGNLDHTIKRFHGWRGTTDDIHISAMGVRTCTEATRTEYQKTVHYKIVFGADECPEKD